MILNIDVSAKDFAVTKAPEPKVDQNGVQRVEKETGHPIWSTELVCTDDSGGEIIRINTAGKAPDVEVGDPVEVINLVAIPWHSKERQGIAWKADDVRAFPES